LPALPSHQLEVVYFGGCGGNLHLIVGKIDENLRYDIWELKEDYSGWIVRYYIDLRSIKSYGHGHVDVSCVVRQPPKEDEDEESMLAILVVDMKKFVAYNLKDHSSRIFHERREPYLPYFHPPFFETLADVI
ncbi:hypothetical protein PIB30_067027, partial [Stylosanthes scabra]|nr:hypothetical protein [Stylosanthes scabra]